MSKSGKHILDDVEDETQVLEQQAPHTRIRGKLFQIIFEAETPLGRAFDFMLLWAIVLSVLVVVLESVSSVRQQYGALLTTAEWVFTLLFTLEYFCRIICVRYPWQYIRSFFGLVDLLSIIPTYLSLIIPGAQLLLVIRAIRLLRVFRLLKLARYTEESKVLVTALRASLPKITVFIGGVPFSGADHGLTHVSH